MPQTISRRYSDYLDYNRDSLVLKLQTDFVKVTGINNMLHVLHKPTQLSSSSDLDPADEADDEYLRVCQVSLQNL